MKNIIASIIVIIAFAFESITHLDGDALYPITKIQKNLQPEHKLPVKEWGKLPKLSIIHARGMNELIYRGIAYGSPFRTVMRRSQIGLTEQEAQYKPFNHSFFLNPANAQYANLFVRVANDDERDAMIQYCSEHQDALAYLAKNGNLFTGLAAGIFTPGNILLLALAAPALVARPVIEGVILSAVGGGGGAWNVG